MAKVTMVLGAILIVMGLGAYFGTGAKSITAMIPAFFGLPIVLAGAVALKEKLRMHAMHVAVLLTLLGFLGGARGFVGLFKLLKGGTVQRPNAVYVQVGLSVVCLVHVILSVRSFIQARRAAPTEQAEA
ncbi:MAG: hypothetical protein AAGJ35_04895 [Myxococcota bacterium]